VCRHIAFTVIGAPLCEVTAQSDLDLESELAACRAELSSLHRRLASLDTRGQASDYAHICQENADYRDLFEKAPIAYVHEGVDSRFLKANRAAVEMLGIAPSEVDGLVGMSLVSMEPDTQRRLSEALASLSAGRNASELLELRRHDGGEPLWVQWWSHPRADGTSTRTLLLDVTDRVLMEQAKAALEFSIESGQVGEWDLDLDHDTSRRSLTHDQCFGYGKPVPEAEWGSQRFFSHIHPLDRVEVEAGFRAAVDRHHDWDSEFRVVWADGSVHWLIARGRRYRAKGSARMLGIVLDITPRKVAEERLREIKAALDFALQSTAVGDWDLDLENDTSRRSLRHDQCFGYNEPIPDADWGIDAFIRHIHPDDRLHVETSMRDAIGALRDWECEFRVVWPAGAVRWLSARGSIYRTIAGRATRMLGIVMDINERKEAEEALIAASRNRELAIIDERNRLARDIHDTLAQGFTGVIVQLQAAEDAQARGLVAEAAAHFRQASDMARYGLQEARRSVHALRPQALEGGNLYSAISEMFSSMTEGTDLRATVTVVGTLGYLRPDWELNLLRIAQEALTNVVRHARATRLDTTIRFTAEQIELTVKDNGCGFDRSTKYDGFGLVGMAERAAVMGGSLSIESTVAIGTLIHICLPLAVAAEGA
jgi:PAS domain S-box-containing protein